MFRDARVQPRAEMVEDTDLRVRSLFQAWQLMGSRRKLWYAMANQMGPGSGSRNQGLVDETVREKEKLQGQTKR